MIAWIRTVPAHHRVYSALLAAALAVVIWVGAEFALTERAARHDIATITESVTRLADARTGVAPTLSRDVLAEVGRWERDANGQITTALGEFDATRKDMGHQITALRTDLLDPDKGAVPAAIRTVADVANAQGQTLNATVDAALNGGNGLVPAARDFLAVYQALPDRVANDRIFRAYEAQGLGTLAVTKLTMGQVEKTMQAVELATPSITENIKNATSASVDASQNAATVMKNLATATKPLPTWMRIGLGVAPPLASTAAAAATAWSIIH